MSVPPAPGSTDPPDNIFDPVSPIFPSDSFGSFMGRAAPFDDGQAARSAADTARRFDIECTRRALLHRALRDLNPAFTQNVVKILTGFTDEQATDWLTKHTDSDEP